MSRNSIVRYGSAARWSDMVVHHHTAYWVEVAARQEAGTLDQARQILEQIDATLVELGSDRERLLTVLVYLADPADLPQLNEAWDAWVPAGHAPVRACVGALLPPPCRVEMVITAAVD
ncbi:MAG: RidA family protein [Pirellulaceae bacterium]|jgi:enamine deaminase RidA (YjgF/YER057c/UK114 family)|nr:RidA family protein [Pirellulaceae bacterium]